MVRTETDMNGGISSPNTTTSNGITLNTSDIQSDPVIVQQSDDDKDEKVSRNFTISLHKRLKFSIYKPLIPLKIALFIWYGAGASIGTFLLVFLKQRGLSLNELSITFVLTPLVQFIALTISGVIADKLGRSKPILVMNLILLVIIVGSMLLIPSMNIVSCEPQLVKLKCHHNEYGRLIAKTSCDVNTDVIELASCNVTCPENVTQYCNGQNLICEMLEGNEDFDNLSLSVHVNWAYKLRNKCYYNVTSMSHQNVSYSWCSVPHKMYCRIACLMNPEEDCGLQDDNRTVYLILNMILIVLFNAVFSNTYRFMDVTTMCLVKEHNSDFGRERLFAIAGILIFSPLSGYIVDVSTPEGSEKNYDIVFYLFFGLVFLLLCSLYKLNVTIRQPGRNMWKKSLRFLGNADNIAFITVLFILGASWGFIKNLLMWYLEEMKVQGFLLGLITSISALYGIPFLFTSNWWVRKIGTTQIFVIALLGYVVSAIGYSLLYDPWLSLLIEATSIATYHLFWVAVIVHSHNIAPEGLKATIIATAGGVHYCLGKSAGGFFGGQIMGSFGGRIAFRIIASVCLITAVFYAIYLYIRKTCFSGTHDLKVKEENESNIYEATEVPKEMYTLQIKSQEEGK